jgi:hypothetical protein
VAFVPTKNSAPWVGIVALGLICSGCNRVVEWTFGHTLSQELRPLEQSDRLVITSGSAELPQEKVITSETAIRDVVTFFERYSSGWLYLSGSPGDYRLYLYKGDTLLQVLALSRGSPTPSDDTLSLGGYYRRAPAAEVAALARRLDLPWPATRK